MCETSNGYKYVLYKLYDMNYGNGKLSYVKGSDSFKDVYDHIRKAGLTSLINSDCELYVDTFGNLYSLIATNLLDENEGIKGVYEKTEATWIYYTNDEGKARWKCSNCGKVCRRNPHDKTYCSHCGKKMKMEA